MPRLIALIVACLLAGPIGSVQAAGFFITEKVSVSYDFKLKDTNNSEFDFAQLRNKPFVMFFWTTWCPYCREQLKFLQTNYANYQKEGLVVLPIDVGESQARVTLFLKSRKLTFPILLDQDTLVAREYEILGIPTYILVDAKGTIRYRGHIFPHREYKKLITEK